MKYQIYGQTGINDEVINYYLNLIKCGVEMSDSNNIVEFIGKIGYIERYSIGIYYTATDAMRCWLKNRNSFYIWTQGIYPEERRLRKNSVLDYYLVSAIEYFVLRKAKKIFMVSEDMLNHYEKKYRMSLKSKTFIMPCYNCQLNEEAFKTPEKYTKPTFCYVGSLSEWQCFEETVELYKNIEQHLHGSKFYVFTKSIDEAKEILERNDIRNYELMYVPADELHEHLKQIKYGFIIRKNIAVNRVATPTKFSNYVSNGIIPVYSECIGSYKRLSQRFKYLIMLNNNENIDSILDFEKVNLFPESIMAQYKEIFNSQYSDEKNIIAISDFIVS